MWSVIQEDNVFSASDDCCLMYEYTFGGDSTREPTPAAGRAVSTTAWALADCSFVLIASMTSEVLKISEVALCHLNVSTPPLADVYATLETRDPCKQNVEINFDG